MFCFKFASSWFSDWHNLGVPLIDGGTVRLPALIGLSRAMDLILTGRPIKAKEAFEWGLANRIVAVGTGNLRNKMNNP